MIKVCSRKLYVVRNFTSEFLQSCVVVFFCIAVVKSDLPASYGPPSQAYGAPNGGYGGGGGHGQYEEVLLT